MDWPSTYERRIRYSDTDAQGIVFNANYLVYFDDALTDYFWAMGYEWDTTEMVLANVEIDFVSSVRLGDTLVVGVRVTRIGNTSIRLELEGWEKGDGRPVVRGRQIQVTVSADSFEPVTVPDDLRQAIVEFQGLPGE